MKRYAILVLGLAAIGLSGCGIRGDLERPPPVWGPDQRTPAEREHEREEAGETETENNDPGDWVFEEEGEETFSEAAGPDR